MKVARPPDQGVKDKGGPVCSTQRQTEPVASFVPQNFSITMCILLSCFHPFSNPLLPPSTLCPPLKRTSVTFDPLLFKFVIQNQPAGFLFPGVILISDISILVSTLSHDGRVQGLVGCCLMKRYKFYPPPPQQEHTGGLS